MILIIWFVCWRGLTSRDDPLDPHAFPQKQFGEDLPVRVRGKVIEKVDHGSPRRQHTRFPDDAGLLRP
jgi:hypothetical protein